MDPESLSTYDVASYCGVSPRTVLRWVDAGILPGFRTGGGRRRILKAEVAELMGRRGMAVPEALRPVRRRVTLIDHNQGRAAVTATRLLHVAPHLEIETATDGFSAGTLVFSFRPHLVVLDLQVPGMDSVDVCRRIREDPDLESTGIVVVSTRFTMATREKLMGIGADECLDRPLRSTDLEHVIGRFVSQAPATPTPAVAG